MNESEIVFLDGSQSRWRELTFAFKTLREMIVGFRALHFIGPCITIFGSAGFAENHPYYALTRDAAAAFARLGFTIFTGGGLMEAANRGAVIIFGKAYHRELPAHIDSMQQQATIGLTDIHLFLVTDSIEEAVQLIAEKSIKLFGLRPKKKIKPFSFLFEHS